MPVARARASESRSGERGNHGHAVEKRRKKGNIKTEEEEEEDRKSGPLSSTSARVLAALMETRSRELPLTAAKPIYLRPRSLLPSPFSVHGSPLLEVASPSLPLLLLASRRLGALPTTMSLSSFGASPLARFLTRLLSLGRVPP